MLITIDVIQYKNIVVTYNTSKDIIFRLISTYDIVQERRCDLSFVMTVGIQCFEKYRELSLRT